MKQKKDKRIYVTTDTHGCVEQLANVLEQAKFDYEQDTLIHLGDVVDRGYDSYGVVELLLRVKNLIAIRGNHDDWFLDFINKGVHGGRWFYGGDKTILSYERRSGRSFGLHEVLGSYVSTFNSTDIPDTHKEFFRNQRIHYTDEQGRFFCHAGYNPDFLIEEQQDFMFYWDRSLLEKLILQEHMIGYAPNYEDINKFSRVFIGHTRTLEYPKDDILRNKPMYLGQLVDLDTGGHSQQKGGKISLIDITDDTNHILYQA